MRTVHSTNGADQSCRLPFFLIQKNRRDMCEIYKSRIRRGYLRTRITADNNIYANDKRAELHSAQDEGNKSVQRTGADIPGRRRALLRYSRTKSLPNSLRVPNLFVFQLVYTVRMERKYEAQETRIYIIHIILGERFA